MATPDLSYIPGSIPSSTGNATLDQFANSGLKALKTAPITDVLNSDAFAQIRKLLAPGADGGLNPNLEAMYNYGAKKNALQGSSNRAAAMSDAVGRGLEGSTVEAAGVNSAAFGEQMGNADLLASLFGTQNANSSNLANYLFQGQSSNNDQVNQRLQMLIQLLSSTGESAANIGMFNNGMAASDRNAKANRESQLIGSIISGGAAAGGAWLGS